MRLSVILMLFAALLCSCSVSSRRAGVDNQWRQPGVLESFEEGKSTSTDVLDAFGPPSQLINLGDRTVYYYLLEKNDTAGLFLVFYNSTDTLIDYDRAIFFFDKNEVLEKMSVLSLRALLQALRRAS